MDKSGVLDPDVMHPLLRQREDDEPGIMTEMAVDAARQAMAQAGRSSDQIDAVICAASNHERAYPAVAIEVQEALGIEGFAYDMNVACSSATFAVQNAADMIRSSSANTVLIVNPEICSDTLSGVTAIATSSSVMCARHWSLRPWRPQRPTISSRCSAPG